MIGISIPAKKEWEATLERFNITLDDCTAYPLGEYFKTNLYGQDLIIYRCGVRKMNCSASTQYMIDHFNLKKIIVIGTCAGINPDNKVFDIIMPNKLVQYDCTVKEMEPLIKESFNVYIDVPNNIKSGTVGTADKPVVMWKDYLELKENNITIADTESAAIAYICKANNVECCVIRGISDFPSPKIETESTETYNNQLNEFLTNIPIIINNIFDNYIEIAINNKFNYIEK